MTAQHTVPPASRRHSRHAAWSRVASAVSAVALVATMTACEKHSPVAAPTPTIAVPTESEPSPTATVPEYTTDLDLNAEEKKAVEEALVTFDGYIGIVNKVFSSGGQNIDGAETFATGDSLKSLKDEAATMKKNSQYMAGTYDYYNLRIHDVALRTSPKITLLYCTHDSNHAVVDLGSTMPSQRPTSLTMKYTASKQSNSWKISNQELWSKKCE